jgi:diguanylate cyclase (GGDEF)-like protein/PAS domain S-box-containing protein
LQPGKATKLNAVYHFTFTGKEEKQATVTIRDGALQVRDGHQGEPHLRVFADNIPAMTASWDENLICRFANEEFGKFFGVKDIVGKHLRDIAGAKIYRELEGHFAEALRGNPVTYQRTRKLRAGDLRYLEAKLVPHVDDLGNVLGCFSVTTDITAHKLAEERIQRVAHHDSLTGLPNRLLFNDRMSQAIMHAKRNRLRFALLYLDLDRFKPVNDTLGHAAGDELLKQVAARIGRQVRESDTVARVGGDEFLVILLDIAERGQAQTVARKIVAAFTAPFHLDSAKQDVEIGTSVGIAMYPADALDADALVKAADAAMYSAKQAGNYLQLYAA